MIFSRLSILLRLHDATSFMIDKRPSEVHVALHELVVGVFLSGAIARSACSSSRFISVMNSASTVRREVVGMLIISVT